MFDHRPKILVSRNLRHAPLGKIIYAPAQLSKTNLCTNMKSLAQTVCKTCWSVCQKFWRSRDLGHTPLWENYLCARSAFPTPKTKLFTKFEVFSWSIFEDMLDCMLKILGVRWLSPHLFLGYLFVRQLGFSKSKLCTKFEGFSLCSFEDMFDRMP